MVCRQCIKKRRLSLILALLLLSLVLCNLIFNWQWGINVFGNYYPHKKSQDLLALIPLLTWFYINKDIFSREIHTHRQ